MQKEFLPIVEEATSRCQGYFAERFIASYLHGSINRSDAVPGVSDLDYYVVIADPLQDTDERWLHVTEEELQRKYPIVEGVHVSVHTLEELKEDRFGRFMLAYNARLWAGEDIVKALNASGCDTYEPNEHVAKARLAFARQCFSEAVNHQQPACTGELPENTYYIARKYARYFVVIEGAYYLMSQGRFTSFAKEEVLEQLCELTEGFNRALELTKRVLDDPEKANVSHDRYLSEIGPLVNWMFDQVEDA